LYKERNEKVRETYKKEMASYHKEDMVYIDESGIDECLHRNSGWSLKGSKIHGEVSGKKYERESFIAAKRGSKILAPFCFKGTCNTSVFNTWIEKVLLPCLKPGQVVVMDNATFHKSAKTRELIQSAGCKLVFLPPYSPDLNPIEIFWANFKKKLSRILHHFKSLSHALDNLFQQLSHVN
jgi:transposase